MELPVYEDQVPAGTLRICPQGLYTVFETRLPPGEGLSRLWLLGEGRRWSLGLLEPREEGRFLRRRLTRLQLRALPPRIDRVLVLPSDAPAPPPNASTRHCEPVTDVTGVAIRAPSSAKKTDCTLKGRPHGQSANWPRNDRGEKSGAAAPGPTLPEGGRPEGAGGSPSSPAWLRLPDGSLLDPARRLLALPCAPGAAPARARKFTLDGREYWLFRT